MKLGDLAHVRQGVNLQHKWLKSGPIQAGKGYGYLRMVDMEEKQMTSSVLKKDIQRLGLTNGDLLQYGDFLLFKNRDEEYRIMRYENTTGQTLASDEFYIIRSDYSIIKDYFSFESNKRNFMGQLEKLEKVDLDSLKGIGIYTDNITELEEPNEAQELGIHKALNSEDIREVKVIDKPLSLSVVLKDIADKLILLDTDFQRRPGLWDIGRKSRLIESFILKLPIPAFYFDAGNDNWRIIDGLQRLSAAYEFIIDKKFVLTELDYMPDLNGKSFDELSRLQQRNIEQYTIFAYIVEKGTPRSIVYKMFKSINTSALLLENQEIRHAINPGKPAEFLKKVADSEWFKECIPLSDRQRDRMYDREIVLRFLAFQRKKYPEYQPSIVDFLDSAMVGIYDMREVELNEYEKKLEEILEIVHRLLGPEAYSRHMFDNSRAYRFNPIIFEQLTYAIGLLSKEKINILCKSNNTPNRIRSYFKKQTDSFWESDKAYTQQNLIERFQKMEQLIKDLTT